MTHDPDQGGTAGTPVTGSPVTSVPILWPPESGPGSEREAWVAFAHEVARGNEEAWEAVDEQGARIGRLEAEVARLRARLAEREPSEGQPAAPEPATPEPTTLEPTSLDPAQGGPADATPRAGGRRTSEDTRAAIRADLAAGLSQSQAARRHGVSAMTVSRLVRGG